MDVRLPLVLKISQEVWQRMQAYTLAAAPNEVTGIGTIRVTNGALVVDEIFIPRQMIGPTYCETVNGALNEIMAEVMEKDLDRVSDLRFRFHSHALSEVFWSATDEKDIDAWQGPWAVNLVMNVQGDCRARLDIYGPVRVAGIPLLVEVSPVLDEVFQRCRLELLGKTSKISTMSLLSLLRNADSRKDVNIETMLRQIETELAGKGGEENEV